MSMPWSKVALRAGKRDATSPEWARGAMLAVGIVQAILSIGCSPAPPAAPWIAPLATELEAIDEKFDGNIGAFIKDLKTGASLSRQAERPWYLGSAVKLIVLATVYRLRDAGRLDLQQQLTFNDEDIRDGSGTLRLSREGTKYTVEQLVDLMIGISDNGATDMLVGHLGTDEVNRTMRELQLECGEITSLFDVRLQVYGRLDPKAASLTTGQVFELWRLQSLGKRAQRLGEWLHNDKKRWSARDLRKAYDDYFATGVNSAPLTSMASLIERIATEKLYLPAASRAMLEKLKGCTTGERRLRAGLPDGTVLAHKTGTQHERACDIGVAYFAADWPVVMAICTESFHNAKRGETTIGRVAEAAYRHISGVARVRRGRVQ